ncbi:hypothetical protein ABZ714_19660 [Streptomyces sp. NPDC006798]|uniref:hypothetical protein n=1 Tax=Streptomyces sp. NPDC006798 TaxID=3155462 RepID=UPI0033E65826
MVWLVVVVAVGSGVGVLWQRHRYPGGWAFSFSRLYRTERLALAKARGAAREVVLRAARAESAALAGVTSADAAHEARLHRLEQRLAGLRHPGSGARLGSLGELDLFQHVVMVNSAVGSRAFELAGLHVRFEPGRKVHSIYLTDAAGRVHRAKYSLQTPAGPDEEQFDEVTVGDFAVLVQNAVADENIADARRPRQIEKTEKELQEARVDTRALDAARDRLRDTRQRNRRDPRRKSAESELETASRVWEGLTGRVPPR